MKDQTGTIKTGIPFLKDVPVLGKLFTQTVHQSVKSELVIVLRPVIVDAKQWSEQLEGSLDFINRIDRGL
jgi:MSHA biogenesis protein MshL